MTQELYELPEGWEWHQLKDLCSFENGDRGKNYPSRAHFVDKGIPVISARALNGWEVEKKYINYITQERYDLLGSGKIKKGDVLFCLRGSLGKTALVEDLDQGAIASSLVIVRANSEILNSYLLFYFNSGLSQKYIQKYNNGAAQPNLSANSLAKFYIPAPNVDEQQRLVKKLDALLSRIDTAITHLQHSLELNDQLFISSLNQVFNPLDAEVQPDGTYQLPEDWEWLEFKKIFSTKGYSVGKIKNSEYKAEGAYPVIDQSQKYIAGYFDEHDLVYQGELPVLIYGDHTNAVKYVDFKFISGADGTKVLTISDQVASKYAYYLVDRFKPETQGYRRHFSILNKILLPVCMLDEQNKIARALELIEIKTQENKQVLQRKLEQLQQLKTSLLDSTFKGNL